MHIYILCFCIIFLQSISCTIKKKEGKKIKNNSNKYIDFNYKIIHKDTIFYCKYIEVNEPIEKKLYKDSAEYNVYIREIDINYPIRLYNYSEQKPVANETPFARHDRDFLQIGSEKFIFDKLEFKDSLTKECPKYFALRNAYSFYFNKDTFFVGFFEATRSRSKPNYLICLFNITNKDKPNLLLFEYQASHTIDCLGDFNQDGYLDFAHKVQLENKLTCKTLKNGNFEELEEFYLTIIDSPHEPKIDLQKSRWFFKLK